VKRPQIGKDGMSTDIPIGGRMQYLWDPDDKKLKVSVIAGSTFFPVLRPLRHNFYLTRTADSFQVVQPTCFPFYLFHEAAGSLKLYVVAGPDMEPVEILQELTRAGGRREVLTVLKSLAQNDAQVPMHVIDLLDVAQRIASGELTL
jgi:hypothetical protein